MESDGLVNEYLQKGHFLVLYSWSIILNIHIIYMYIRIHIHLDVKSTGLQPFFYLVLQSIVYSFRYESI